MLWQGLGIGVKLEAVSLVRCWLLEPKMQGTVMQRAADDRESQFKGVMCSQWAPRRSEPPVWSHERPILSLLFLCLPLIFLKNFKDQSCLQKCMFREGEETGESRVRGQPWLCRKFEDSQRWLGLDYRKSRLMS